MMKKLVIQKVDHYNYLLVDDNKEEYNLNIEFYSNYKPQVKDIVYVDEKILRETNLFAFGDISKDEEVNPKDIMKVANINN